MASPFPGMDPFIEARGLWADFHDKLIGELERAISSRLPTHYAARVRERTYIEWIDPLEAMPQSGWFEPDVKVRTTTNGKETVGMATAVHSAPEAVTMHALAEEEQRELYLDLIELDPERRLVTSVEVLSPANKAFGSNGWKEYERKRQIFLQGRANLVEIDLLRGGHRRPMVEAWPESPYYGLVMRKETAPECQVTPAFSDRPLPNIAIPLIPPDGDLVIELQSLVAAIYERSRYAGELGYDRPIQPALSAAEAALLAK